MCHWLMKIVIIIYFLFCFSDSAPHSPDIPRSIVIGRGNKPKTFPSAGAENNKGASLTNDDQTVIPDDYTLQHWQKVILQRSILLFLWI